jgi:hypothetical protein
MKRLARAAVITQLRDLLEREGSWCGETHLQKACYLLQEGVEVPLEFDFILYKHGPFSFDLRAELTELRTDALLELQPQPYPYGPRLVGTERAKTLRSKFPITLRRYGRSIEAVAHLVGSRGVVELERLATSVLMFKEHPEYTVEQAANAVREVKPHVGETAAIEAAREAFDFLSSQNRSASSN